REVHSLSSMRMECMRRITEQCHAVPYPRVDLYETGSEICDSRPCLHHSKRFGQFRCGLSYFLFETSYSFLLQVFKAASSNAVEDVCRSWACGHYPEHLSWRLVLPVPILQLANCPR